MLYLIQFRFTKEPQFLPFLLSRTTPLLWLRRSSSLCSSCDPYSTVVPGCSTTAYQGSPREQWIPLGCSGFRFTSVLILLSVLQFTFIWDFWQPQQVSGRPCGRWSPISSDMKVHPCFLADSPPWPSELLRLCPSFARHDGHAGWIPVAAGYPTCRRARLVRV